MENNPRITRSIFVLISILIVGVVLWNTYLFYNQLKDNERDKMTIFAAALQENAETSLEELGEDQGMLALNIVQSNTTTPLILYSHIDDSYDLSNIPEASELTKAQILDKVARFKQEYNPIPIKYEDELLQTVYYGNSPLINKVKYYPAAILLVIIFRLVTFTDQVENTFSNFKRKKVLTTFAIKCLKGCVKQGDNINS